MASYFFVSARVRAAEAIKCSQQQSLDNERVKARNNDGEFQPCCAEVSLNGKGIEGRSAPSRAESSHVNCGTTGEPNSERSRKISRLRAGAVVDYFETQVSCNLNGAVGVRNRQFQEGLVI